MSDDVEWFEIVCLFGSIPLYLLVWRIAFSVLDEKLLLDISIKTCWTFVWR
jgi:hypothetical protein